LCRHRVCEHGDGENQHEQEFFHGPTSLEDVNVVGEIRRGGFDLKPRMPKRVKLLVIDQKLVSRVGGYA
jgi:hypothetical protein